MLLVFFEIFLKSVHYDNLSQLNASLHFQLINQSSVKFKEEPSGCPSVELLDVPVVEPIKFTIGVRKIQPKKAGQRKGMGATKVKTNFAELEQRAVMAGQFRDSTVNENPLTVEEEENVVQSVRLAYQDLSLQAAREGEKLKSTNPNKAKQMERLGMGFSNAQRNAVSHSVMSDMQTIIQETSGKYVTAKSSYERDVERERERELDFFDDYTMYSNGSARKDDFRDMAASMGFETIEPIENTPAVRSMFTPADKSNRIGVNGKYWNTHFKRSYFIEF